MFIKRIFILSIIIFILITYRVLFTSEIMKDIVVNNLRTKYVPKITLLILCHDKTTDFKNMLDSLFDIRGVPSRVDILVSQSGTNKQVYDIATDYGLRIVQHEDHDLKTENRLAKHFKWSFNAVFNIYPASEGLIVIEDDFLFSPDFLEYFELTIPLLKMDPTLFTVSAWNDIGYKQNTHDPHNIKRVSFFPGLGWYLSRDTWENKLSTIWPTSDWDWVVRKYVEANKLEIIIPEISRDYHAASTGTYMKKMLFDQYFKNIEMNNDSEFRWDNNDIDNIDNELYSEMMIRSLQDQQNTLLFVNDKRLIKSKTFAKQYGVWHEPLRGSWRGIRTIWDIDHYLHIIDLTTHPEWSFYRRPIVTL